MILICGIIAWSLTIFTCLNLIRHCNRGIKHLQRLHQIPCSRCQYFTNSCYLKCTVNPHIATSESAIACRDFVEVANI
jgi:hypothetical protein